MLKNRKYKIKAESIAADNKAYKNSRNEDKHIKGHSIDNVSSNI